jgi:hypothetical protein
MMYFSGFCRRYADKIYPDRTMHGEGSGDPELDMFMLFARINVFEEIVDYYNKSIACITTKNCVTWPLAGIF